ncbi:hypothetical protein QQY24_14770 [Streptomyces sp. TG1A-8]|uniref:hypothetical protein n=1 Tax=Streptomyces sp. TG1A-8 TaxID=3051385 RepID=UPI00265BA7D9|nr:hypothetical protein [Streptomyces sp. TG1A-8]MDO0926614.1 hypothetical protein [Streptomyces sp. TG1A-8]
MTSSADRFGQLSGHDQSQRYFLYGDYSDPTPERSRWPLPSLAAVTACTALAVTLWEAAGK